MNDKVSLLDTILPNSKDERIAVIGYSNHFKFFVRLLCDRTNTDLRKNYIYASYPNSLRGMQWAKIIVLNNYPEVNKFYNEFEYLEKVKHIPVISIEDRDL